MSNFFLKLAIGRLRRHRLEALLCLFGVVLGVAVVIAIDSAVAACVGSFRGAVDSMAERSTHSIFPASGQTLSDQDYLDLLQRKLLTPLAPVIERGVIAQRAGQSSAEEGQAARLMGVDVFSEKRLRSFTQMQSTLSHDGLQNFLTEPNQVVMVDALAKQLGVHVGDTVDLSIGSRRVPVHIAGLFEPTGVARAQLTDLILADLATAQELTGALGHLDRIDVRLENQAEETNLAAALPASLILRSTSDRESSMAELIQSYKLNLNALSLMASLVAVFIVYNSMLISVQQRRKSLGILRCVGATSAQLGGVYIAEAILLALTGGVLGVLCGWGLSHWLVSYIATTINDLYVAVRPAPVTLHAIDFAKGLAISVTSCLVGAAVPVLQAARVPPVNVIATTPRVHASRRAAVALLWVGVLLLAGSLAIYALPIASPLVGFAMAAMIALGFAFACPWLLRWTSHAVDCVGGKWQWLPVQIAGSGASRALGITAVATAATMLAMAMNIGVRTMVSSFRGSLSEWVDHRFAADIFVSSELTVRHKIDATLDPAVIRWIESQSQVKTVSPYRGINASIAGKSCLVAGTDVASLLADGSIPIKFKRSTPLDFNPATDALISEPLAGRTHWRAGDTVTVDTPTGPHSFHIFAIFYDFGSERGQLMLDRNTFAQDWNDHGIGSLHVTLKDHTQAAMLTTQWSKVLRQNYPVVLNSFGGLKTEILAVFDRTFRVTQVLTWLAGGVAFCGLAGSLLAVCLARQRDYGLLVALGMSNRQIELSVLSHGLIIGWLSALIAMVAGTALAYVLAYVIQYRSFGWSIPTSPQPRFWWECFLMATVAALVAAVYPIHRLRKTPPAGVLRTE